MRTNFTDVASRAIRPVENMQYNVIRGDADQGGGGWPTNDAVYALSFMGLLRTKTGIAGFDLPTEAQWEYACRAGTTTYYNDGLVTPENTSSNAQMNVLGRYRLNGGYLDGSSVPATDCSPSNGTAVVGSYLPNAWGLYDMHGNVMEWCLDWYADTLAGGTDPVGPVTGTNRLLRSGAWNQDGTGTRSANRVSRKPDDWWEIYDIGFRLVRTLP